MSGRERGDLPPEPERGGESFAGIDLERSRAGTASTEPVSFLVIEDTRLAPGRTINLGVTESPQGKVATVGSAQNPYVEILVDEQGRAFARMHKDAPDGAKALIERRPYQPGESMMSGQAATVIKKGDTPVPINPSDTIAYGGVRTKPLGLVRQSPYALSVSGQALPVEFGPAGEVVIGKPEERTARDGIKYFVLVASENLANNYISREHATIGLDAKGYYLVVTGKNGVYVNGTHYVPSESGPGSRANPLRIQSTDTISLGGLPGAVIADRQLNPEMQGRPSSVTLKIEARPELSNGLLLVSGRGELREAPRQGIRASDNLPVERFTDGEGKIWEFKAGTDGRGLLEIRVNDGQRIAVLARRNPNSTHWGVELEAAGGHRSVATWDGRIQLDRLRNRLVITDPQDKLVIDAPPWLGERTPVREGFFGPALAGTPAPERLPAAQRAGAPPERPPEQAALGPPAPQQQTIRIEVNGAYPHPNNLGQDWIVRHINAGGRDALIFNPAQEEEGGIRRLTREGPGDRPGSGDLDNQGRINSNKYEEVTPDERTRRELNLNENRRLYRLGSDEARNKLVMIEHMPDGRYTLQALLQYEIRSIAELQEAARAARGGARERPLVQDLRPPRGPAEREASQAQAGQRERMTPGFALLEGRSDPVMVGYDLDSRRRRHITLSLRNNEELRQLPAEEIARLGTLEPVRIYQRENKNIRVDSQGRVYEVEMEGERIKKAGELINHRFVEESKLSRPENIQSRIQAFLQRDAGQATDGGAAVPPQVLPAALLNDPMAQENAPRQFVNGRIGQFLVNLNAGAIAQTDQLAQAGERLTTAVREYFHHAGVVPEVANLPRIEFAFEDRPLTAQSRAVLGRTQYVIQRAGERDLVLTDADYDRTTRKFRDRATGQEYSLNEVTARRVVYPKDATPGDLARAIYLDFWRAKENRLIPAHVESTSLEHLRAGLALDRLIVQAVNGSPLDPQGQVRHMQALLAEHQQGQGVRARVLMQRGDQAAGQADQPAAPAQPRAARVEASPEGVRISDEVVGAYREIQRELLERVRRQYGEGSPAYEGERKVYEELGHNDPARRQQAAQTYERRLVNALDSGSAPTEVVNAFRDRNGERGASKLRGRAVVIATLLTALGGAAGTGYYIGRQVEASKQEQKPRAPVIPVKPGDPAKK